MMMSPMVRASKMRGGMPEMRGSTWTLTVLAVLCFTVGTWALLDPGVSQGVGAEKNSPANSMGYAGSASCRECHERFYQLWSTSKHGLAMQPYTADFAKKNLTPQAKEVRIGKSSYRADIAGETGWILEKGPKGQKKYRIEHALGGKNAYYFLTSFPRGRLQTLPLAYDVRKRE